jgi:hypothetical protein
MGNLVINDLGTTTWRDANGNYHRDDGPAVERTDGTKVWSQHGVRHRDDGPAIEWAHGTHEWYQDGKLHRDDGPAVERTDEDNDWWLNDNCLTFDKWLNAVNISDEDKVMMKLKYG